METKECTYIYMKDGYEMITPSLEHAIERTDQKTVTVKCIGEEPRKISLE